MGKGLKLCALILGCGLAFGCAAQKGGEGAEQARVERFRQSYQASLDEKQELAGQKLLQHARSAIGTPYVLGGTNPGGFDCSGLVLWAYKNVGVKLPRTAREQSVVGESIRNIEDMRAGDIVAFRHPKRGYHTGIYVGDGKFIHSPRKRTRVRINSLSDPYFSQTLLGARRVSLGSGENLVAQAESRLAAYADSRTSAKAASVASAKGKKSAQAQRASKTAKSSKVSKSSAKSAKAAKATGKKSASVASAQKSGSAKAGAAKTRTTASKATASKAGASKQSAQAKSAGQTTAAKSAAKATASSKSGHKTVSSLQAKSGRTRS